MSGDAAQGPASVRTREDFGRELTLLRERAGLTVREVARRARRLQAHSTIGDWFAGRGLPSPTSADLLADVLAACGVGDEREVARWLDVWRRVRRAPGRRPQEPAPYKGLAAFTAEDTDWYFGRQELTARLVGAVSAMLARGGGTLTVVGPSGAGKSSLLQAGLLAAARRGDLLLDAAMQCTPPTLPTRLPATGAAELIVVDQFEEVFGLGPAERERVVRELCTPGRLVVIGLRADFYAAALREPRLAAVLEAHQLIVGPMREPELREAIVGPAARSKVDVEGGLVELLLADLASHGQTHDAGTLPLLSYALYATWASMASRRMTIDGYLATGGIEGAVATAADAVYDALDEAQRGLARRLLVGLVHVTADAADTRRRLRPQRLFEECDVQDDADAARLLESFVERRLVTADAEAVQISHEALITAWPRLRDWLDADRADLLAGRRLAEAAASWQGHGRDAGALYRGAPLVAARQLADRRPPSPPVREFLRASVAAQDAEGRALRRRRQWLGRLVAALTVLAVAALVAGAQAYQQHRQAAAEAGRAAQEARVAVSRQLATEADQAPASALSLATRLSLAAYRIAPTAEARAALIRCLLQSHYAGTLADRGPGALSVAFGPVGRLLAAGYADHTAVLWDVADPTAPIRLATLAGNSGFVWGIALSGDGRSLVTVAANEAVVWDVRTPRAPVRLATLPGIGRRMNVARFVGPDLVATGFEDGTVRLWRVTGGSARPTTTLVQPGPVLSMAVDDAHRRLITNSGDTAVLWDVTPAGATARSATVTVGAGNVEAVAITTDGRTLATASAAGDVITGWDVSVPERPVRRYTLTGHRQVIFALAFSPDGSRLVSGGADTTAIVWDVADPVHPARMADLSAWGHRVGGVAFAADGHTVAVASDITTLWDAVGRGHPGRLAALGAVGAQAVSGDGRTAATLERDHTLTVRRTAGGADPVATATQPVPPTGLALSPDGDLLAAGRPDGSVELRRTTDLTLLGELTVASGAVTALAFSPDGRRLVAAGGWDRTAVLLDVTAPARPRRTGTLNDPDGAVNAVAFSADSERVATAGTSRAVIVWAVTGPGAPHRLSTLAGHTGPVTAVAFAPDSRTLASADAGPDHSVLLWDLTRTAVTATLFTGSDSEVDALATGPGGTLATTDRGGNTLLWDTTDPTHPIRLAELLNAGPPIPDDSVPPVGVVFNPDRPTLFTGVGPAATWDVTLLHEAVARPASVACAAEPGGLTPDEWRRYIPDLPFITICP